MLKPEYMGNTMKGQDLQKRYWVFIIMTYYPYGGLADIEFTTNCREAAIEFANEKITEYADHVLLSPLPRLGEVAAEPRERVDGGHVDSP